MIIDNIGFRIKIRKKNCQTEALQFKNNLILFTEFVNQINSIIIIKTCLKQFKNFLKENKVFFIKY